MYFTTKIVTLAISLLSVVAGLIIFSKVVQLKNKLSLHATKFWTNLIHATISISNKHCRTSPSTFSFSYFPFSYYSRYIKIENCGIKPWATRFISRILTCSHSCPFKSPYLKMKIPQWLPSNPVLHWAFTHFFSRSMSQWQASWFSAEMKPCEWKTPVLSSKMRNVQP